MLELVGDESEVFDKPLKHMKLDILWQAVDEGNKHFESKFDLLLTNNKCYAVCDHEVHDFTDCYDFMRVK